MKTFTYRQQIQHSDIGTIAEIVKSSGFFSTEERDIALELAEEKLTQPHDSSYQFLFAEDEKRVVGYTCYGLVPATSSSYDIYWIVVSKDLRGQGLGKLLMAETEKLILQSGGRQVYVETSSRNQYKPTHKFYETCGYHQEAFLKNFYHEGESKIIYAKVLK
ncbi:d-alanine-d-alanine ligase [hydrocarbon metagenome]|uniref:D-alanine-d-alanine ligase n=1 Tax=hydrocarbon metagenome TaxID=938273 RepID=A0A0W8FUA8_9ZZZZ